MKLDFRPWLIARVVLIAGSVVDGCSRADDKRITWIASVLTSIGIALIVYLWLTFVSFSSRSKPLRLTSDHHVDWSEPYSFIKPFFPPTRYPVRFWFLLSILSISTGLASSTHSLFVTGNISPASGMSILWGAAGFISLLPWLPPFNRMNRERESGS